MGGLNHVGKLAIAVIHHHLDGGVRGLDRLTNLADLLHGQRLSVRIASGALYHDGADPGLSNGLGDGRIIRLPCFRQVHLPVVDAVEFEGTVGVPLDTDGGAQSVIGHAGDGQNGFPGLCQGEHGGGEGVGTVHKADAHKGGLRPEDLGIDLIQGLPAQVVIAIAGGAGKAGLGHLVVLKGLHDPAGVLLGQSVDLGKAGGDARLGPLGHLIYFGTDIGYLHVILTPLRFS